MLVVRRRSRTIEMSEDELEGLLARKGGHCTYCRAGISAKNCIVEEAQGALRLRSRLREYRLQRSRKEGLPAYLIFNDKALDSLVSKRPMKVGDLKYVYGIAEAKTEKYGKELVDIVTSDSVDHPGDDWGHRPICEDCSGSEKKAIRIPKGQVDAIERMGANFTEFTRMAISEALRARGMNEEVEGGGKDFHSNPDLPFRLRGPSGETFVIVRESDGRISSDRFRMREE